MNIGWWYLAIDGCLCCLMSVCQEHCSSVTVCLVKMFDNIFLKDIVSWNTVIDGFVHNGYNCRALELLERLEKESIMLQLDEFGNALLTCMPNVMIWKKLV